MRLAIVSLWLRLALWTFVITLIWGLLATTTRAATYTWVGAGGNSNWSNAANWEPARTPANDDVLIFDGNRTAAASVYVDFASPQTIGQLRFINNVVAVLTVQPNSDATAVPPARQLLLGSALTGANFEIAAGSSVQVKSPEGVRSTAGMGFYLGTEGTATVAGTLVFGSSSTAQLTNDPHQLISLKKAGNTTQFVAGSTFRADRTFTGSPFNDKSESSGTTVFRSGSTYDHRGGGAPFGTSLPTAPVTILEKGSHYVYSVTSTAAGPQLPGRTYGYMEYNRPTTAMGIVGGSADISATGLPLLILNDLIITTGNVRLNLATTAIQGNLIMNGGTLVNPIDSTTITFKGATRQLITSTAATPVPVAFGEFITVVIDNAAGVTLQTPVQIAKALKLNNGVLNTTAGPLTLLAGAVAKANDKSFVSGPLTRVAAASGSTYLTFPLGFGTAFRPLTLSVSHSDGAEAYYTAEQIKGRPTTRFFSGEIKKVSAVRYFNVTRTSAAANFIAGHVRLSYGPDDEVDSPNKLRIAKSSADNQTWDDLGGIGTEIPTGTITSSFPFTGFGTFVLASTEAASSSGNNPLPVELVSFSAERRPQSILVRWATASEKDNAGFEVERSADGRLFATVGKVKGHGQSTQRQTYSMLDTDSFGGPVVYYRVRQLDFDGTATYSNVVAVKGEVRQELFPNPAHNLLTFRLPSDVAATYQLLAPTGQTMQKGQAIGGLTTLDITDLPAGFYYLAIESAAGRVVHKFIKRAE